jgi:hypothetical protein
MNDKSNPLTPRICEACGGNQCQWCTNGFQNIDQQKEWHKFRTNIRKISKTYSLLDTIVNNIIDSLEEIRTEETIGLAREGRILLNIWRCAESGTSERFQATTNLNDFQKRALIMLVKNRLRL